MTLVRWVGDRFGEFGIAPGTADVFRCGRPTNAFAQTVTTTHNAPHARQINVVHSDWVAMVPSRRRISVEGMWLQTMTETDMADSCALERTEDCLPNLKGTINRQMATEDVPPKQRSIAGFNKRRHRVGKALGGRCR